MGLNNMGLVLAFLGFLFLDGLFLCMAEDHHITFILTEQPFERLCHGKYMLVVNESFPGPTIYVRRGDTAYVTVINNGLYGVTLHWHGVKQPRNPWSDGPEYVTQCPIQPGDSFIYEVIFSDEEGTLWWHAHSEWTRATVYGAIVVKPAEDKEYPFDKQPNGEFEILIGEWYNRDVKTMVEDAMAIGGDAPPSNAYTINGQPGYPNDCSNGEISIFNVVAGNTYLLRIVSAVMNEEMFFGIAGHNLTVVGQDGAYIKPIPTSYIMITPGQTMDVLLTANNTFDAVSFFMVATPFSDSGAPFNRNSTSAILNYAGFIYETPLYPAFLPDATAREAADDFTKKIKALVTEEHPIDVPQEIDERIFITVSVNQLPCDLPDDQDSCGGPGGNMHSATLNNISFQNPTIDILQSYYWNLTGDFLTPAPPLSYDTDFPAFPPVAFDFTSGDNAQYRLPALGTKVKVIEYGKNVEIVFQGTNIGNPDNHPMHLHGYSFYLVGTGCGNYYTDPNYHHEYNLVDPPRVNTIGVPKNGWAAIRFKADNPGVWFMHCHLERHASWGMAGVLIVKNGSTPDTSMIDPPRRMPRCV